MTKNKRNRGEGLDGAGTGRTEQTPGRPGSPAEAAPGRAAEAADINHHCGSGAVGLRCGNFLPGRGRRPSR